MQHSTTPNRKVCSSVPAYTRMEQFVVLFCLVENLVFFSFCLFKKAWSTCLLKRLSAVCQRTTTNHYSSRQQGNISEKKKNESTALEPTSPDKTATKRELWAECEHWFCITLPVIQIPTKLPVKKPSGQGLSRWSSGEPLKVSGWQPWFQVLVIRSQWLLS